MKKTYEKPLLTKRERLPSITAQIVPISGPVQNA